MVYVDEREDRGETRYVAVGLRGGEALAYHETWMGKLSAAITGHANAIIPDQV